MQQCNKNVENGVKKHIVSQSISSSFDAQVVSAFSALINLELVNINPSLKYFSVNFRNGTYSGWEIFRSHTRAHGFDSARNVGQSCA